MSLDVILYSLSSASLVGIVGLLPLLIFCSGFQRFQNALSDHCNLLRLLSFAAGSLLGDIYFHLLPEAWKGYETFKREKKKYNFSSALQSYSSTNNNDKNKLNGDHTIFITRLWDLPEVWIISGTVIFYVFEKLFLLLNQDGVESSTSVATKQLQVQHHHQLSSKYPSTKSSITLIKDKITKFTNLPPSSKKTSELDLLCWMYTALHYLFTKLSVNEDIADYHLIEPLSPIHPHSCIGGGVEKGGRLTHTNNIKSSQNYLSPAGEVATINTTPSSSGQIPGKIFAFKNESHLRNNTPLKSDKNNSLPGNALEGISNFQMTTGYLNLLANLIDNFTHGIAIAASYTIKWKVGVLTTCAIFLHEIPHEFGDFAILLTSGFDKWSAVKAQMLTSIGCLLGALVGLIPQLFPTIFIEASTYKILAFTCGGFIHIALIKILPEILKNSDRRTIKENVYHTIGILLGIFFMYLVRLIE